MPDTVHRLQLRGPVGSDAVARRHRAEAAVAGGLPPPRGLPADALLCVRRLRLALPGGALAAVARQAAPVLRQQLDEAWAQAVRPCAASPGAAVPALWFADEAELLVFLARRAAAGDTAAWWWQALVRRGPAAWGAVAAAWLERPQAVPAAVVALGAEAERCCEALGDAACERLAAAVARVYGVGGWGRPAPVESLSPRAMGVRSERAAQADRVPVEHAAPSQAAAAVVRGAAAEAELAASAPARSQARARPARRLIALAQALHREPWRASSAGFAAMVERDAAAPAGEWMPRPDAAADASEPDPMDPMEAEQRLPGPDVARASQASAPASGPAEPVWRREPARPDRSRVDAPRVTALALHSAPLQRCNTPHAGLFFLVPLLQQRGLYGDFTQPAQAGLALHPAWLLHALLHSLRHRGAAGPGADPLPALLQAWAGTPRRPRGPVPWRPWLTTLQRQLQADAAARLVRPERGALAWLVRRPGWVQLGASRIDIGFSLDTHPLAIRAAGLDRDPGWLPAGGRHIAFHFDSAGAAA
jgi:hypothetical protein